MGTGGLGRTVTGPISSSIGWAPAGDGVATCDGEVIGPVCADADGSSGRRDGLLGLGAVSTVASSAPSAADTAGSTCDGDVIGPVGAGVVTAGCDVGPYGSTGTALGGGPACSCGAKLGEVAAYGSIGYALGGGPTSTCAVELGEAVAYGSIGWALDDGPAVVGAVALGVVVIGVDGLADMEVCLPAGAAVVIGEGTGGSADVAGDRVFCADGLAGRVPE